MLTNDYTFLVLIGYFEFLKPQMILDILKSEPLFSISIKYVLEQVFAQDTKLTWNLIFAWYDFTIKGLDLRVIKW